MILPLKYNILSTGLDSLDSNFSKLLNVKIDGTITLKQALQIILSESAGKRTRTGNNIVFRDISDTKNVISGTLSGHDRTFVSVNLD
jgi:hypothetical protein